MNQVVPTSFLIPKDFRNLGCHILPEFEGSGTVEAGPISTLGNVSTRAFVQTGDRVVIGGFIVQGTQTKRVIIRAIGPELTQYGIPNALG